MNRTAIEISLGLPSVCRSFTDVKLGIDAPTQTSRKWFAGHRPCFRQRLTSHPEDLRLLQLLPARPPIGTHADSFALPCHQRPRNANSKGWSGHPLSSGGGFKTKSRKTKARPLTVCTFPDPRLADSLSLLAQSTSPNLFPIVRIRIATNSLEATESIAAASDFLVDDHKRAASRP